MYKIRNIDLAESGRQKIQWVRKNMPLLRSLEDEFSKTKPFDGVRVSISVHLEAKTAYLAKVLAIGGAEVSVTGSNPLSTQDDVAAALAKDGLKVYAWYNATEEEYKEHLELALGYKPNIIIDDGGDLVNLLHTKRQDLLPHVMGGSEETTTGILRLKAMEREGVLKFPMVAVNNAYCKYLFDNRYGTGQSVWDGINRTTNLIVAGKNVVVVGYGWCGKGIAMRAKGLGASVIVCEIDPIKATEAVMDGFKVMTMDKASSIGDIFITATGCKRVIHGEHYKKMKDGAILCNAGHFDVEVCVPELEEMACEKKEQRKNIMGYKIEDGRWINLLAEGRLVNLAAGDGHPAEIMDMSFALQALSAKYVLENYEKLGNKVIDVPEEIDKRVALMKLKSWGIEIDELTEEQKKYLESWC
ncbi:adenosylhomocysteinase [Acetivibrio saccincola]|jgi:adenosylhomocysteinase|uniref:Adenosylhomocysteinase n=1 Tax=Acetivibrio saccincola TaxID=1677857 RepID=A0A2K9E3R2_9FIRM|nr:adenosylhomocysteinase [Acetivibrio saccincola]AUG58362.1 Adenosylhomocysteinase [Acetivibrio saccincola]PQQ66420.1 adenosylhomocysteinase [Acetivibrio saccincola]HOA96914.1 adenosylhomocysteinase [Acetivibrio saccincola]HQD29517.1 adenosylhomocysteinase [Acetivibrio saccincola]